MKSLSKDAKMMIAIVVLVIFAGYYFLIRPQGADVAEARSTRAVIEQSVSDAERMLQVAEGAAASSSPDEDAEDANALDAAIPLGDELADLLRQLKAAAEATGMTHSSIAPSPMGPNPNGPGGSLQLSITATGTHDAARAYLAQLQGMERLVLTEQIGLHVAADGSAQLQLSARVFTQSAPTAITQ